MGKNQSGLLFQVRAGILCGDSGSGTVVLPRCSQEALGTSPTEVKGRELEVPALPFTVPGHSCHTRVSASEEPLLPSHLGRYEL